MGIKSRQIEPSSPSLWSVPAYLPVVQPELTPEAIRGAEQKLGVRLPRAYLDLLAGQNGGYVRRTLPDTVHAMIWGIGPHYPSITDAPRLYEPGEFDDDLWEPRDQHLLIPFDGDGHWFLCFDYRDNGVHAEPSITYVDLEMEHERLAAASFSEFLSLLEVDMHPTLGIVGDMALADAVTALEATLKVTFELRDSWAHGYPDYVCRLSDDPPELAWLSENRVPRGFVRPDDLRYHELRDKLPGNTLRFPEHPDVSIVVTVTENAYERVRKACVRASLATRVVFEPG